MSDKQDLRDQETEELKDQQEAKHSTGETGDEDGMNETVKDPVAELEDEVKDLKDQNLRLFAEFENFRKRTAKERLELFSTANQELMGALLPVLDDFQRALKADENPIENEGVKLIIQKLESTLTNKGLKTMEDSTGKEFDVETMEAVTRIPAPDDSLKGKIIDEVEKGYYLGNKILRYAKVVVGE